MYFNADSNPSILFLTFPHHNYMNRKAQRKKKQKIRYLVISTESCQTMNELVISSYITVVHSTSSSTTKNHNLQYILRLLNSNTKLASSYSSTAKVKQCSFTLSKPQTEHTITTISTVAELQALQTLEYSNDAKSEALSCSGCDQEFHSSPGGRGSNSNRCVYMDET